MCIRDRDGAQMAYNKLKSRIRSLDRTPDLHEEKLDFYKNEFKDAISNDLNTSSMLTVVYDVLKDESLTDFSKLYLIEDFDKVLSLDLIEEEKTVDEDTEALIQKKIEERNEAKKNKNYELADKILSLIHISNALFFCRAFSLTGNIEFITIFVFGSFSLR